MLMTERKAITVLLEQLIDEERDLKNYYRAEKSRIDNNKNDLLNRLERIDNLEREAIDTEGVLLSLVDTAKKLSELLPSVPADQMIQKAAEIMAQDAKENGAEITVSEPQEDNAAEKEQQESGKPYRAYNIKETMLEIQDIIKEKPDQRANVKYIENELKRRHGWEFTNFPQSFYRWRNQEPGIIKKIGRFYFLPDHLRNESGDK